VSNVAVLAIVGHLKSMEFLHPTSHSLYRVFSLGWPIVYAALVFAFGIGESWVAPILPLLRKSLVSMIFCIVLVL
jgi:hypothetical protein